METITKIRKYRTFEPMSQFIATDSVKNVSFALSDLSKSGLEPDDMDIYPTGTIRLADSATAGYLIPYYLPRCASLVHPYGFPAYGYRTKFEYPMGVKGPKYLAPSAEALGKHGLPTSIPYVPPAIHGLNAIVCILCGSKEMRTIIKLLQLPTFGTGRPDGMVHPDAAKAASMDT